MKFKLYDKVMIIPTGDFGEVVGLISGHDKEKPQVWVRFPDGRDSWFTEDKVDKINVIDWGKII